MSRLGRTRFKRAASLAPLIVGVAALIGCSERATAPVSATSLAISGASADRRDGDQAAGAAATLAWEKTTRELVVSHKVIPIVATRLYALHSMAVYAAVAAVGRGGDDGDDGRRGATNATRRGAIAGASVQLLSAIMSDAAPGLQAQLAAYGQAESGRAHTEFARGVEIGRAASNVMVAWATNDGFSLAWNESMRNPSGVGIWEGAAAVAPAVRPAPAGYQYPAMRPYFLKSRHAQTAQSQFRAPPPPVYLGDRFNTDLAEVKNIALTRTQAQTDIANVWNLAAGTISTLGHWNEQAAMFIAERGLDEQEASHLFALLNAATMDATIGCWDTKYHFLMLRPTMADPTIKLATGVPGFPYTLPNHPSYPSGHSCLSSSAVTILSHYFPTHAAELNAALIEAGLSRIYGGIHYRFDIEAGQALGRSTAEWALAYDRRHGVLAALGNREHEDGERDRR